MLAAGYAERERIKQEQGNVLLFWSFLSALITSSSVLFSLSVSGLILIIWEQITYGYCCYCFREFLLCQEFGLTPLDSDLQTLDYFWEVCTSQLKKQIYYQEAPLCGTKECVPYQKKVKIWRLKKYFKHCIWCLNSQRAGVHEIGLENKTIFLKPVEIIGFTLRTLILRPLKFCDFCWFYYIAVCPTALLAFHLEL